MVPRKISSPLQEISYEWQLWYLKIHPDMSVWLGTYLLIEDWWLFLYSKVEHREKHSDLGYSNMLSNERVEKSKEWRNQEIPGSESSLGFWSQLSPHSVSLPLFWGPSHWVPEIHVYPFLSSLLPTQSNPLPIESRLLPRLLCLSSFSSLLLTGCIAFPNGGPSVFHSLSILWCWG